MKKHKFKKGDIVKVIDEKFDDDFNFKNLMGVVERLSNYNKELYYINFLPIDWPCFVNKGELKKTNDREAFLYYLHGPAALIDNEERKN